MLEGQPSPRFCLAFLGVHFAVLGNFFVFVFFVNPFLCLLLLFVFRFGGGKKGGLFLGCFCHHTRSERKGRFVFCHHTRKL